MAAGPIIRVQQGSIDAGEMEPELDLASLVNAALGAQASSPYLDRVSGKVLPAAEVAARCGAAVAVQERYVRVPAIAARMRLDDARDFVAAMPHAALQRRLEKLLRGPRAPWAFEHELARWPEVARAWQAWERACATARVLGWLGRIGLPFPYP
jgi:Uncharacterised protein family (UPF0158)